MPKEKLNHDPFLAWLATLAVAGLLCGCGGGDKEPPGGAGTPSADAPATPPPAVDTSLAGSTPTPGDTPVPPGGAATGGDVRDGAEASIKLFALGDSIFHGQVGGGTCYACHGKDAKGSAVAPDLTDGEWLNTDGSLAGITKTIQTGVPTPKKAPAPMPPMGGASLTPDQVRAVAAYEYSLSHRGD
jgi:mono/diheme cytochrome c family protein